MDKAIFVTGANGGIGKALIRSLKKDNWFVIGSDHPKKIPDQNLLSVCDKWLPLDLQTLSTSKEKVESLKMQIDEYVYGNNLKFKGLIQNAALQITKPFMELSAKEWEESFSVNILSIVQLNKIFIPYLEKNMGSILHIGSIHRRLTKKNFSAYSTTKAALYGLTNSMAVELGDKIRVNIIEPAAIDTEMLRSGFNYETEKIKKLESLHPTNSIGKAEDIARAAIFLLDSRNSFINGTSLNISGGIHAKLHDL